MEAGVGARDDLIVWAMTEASSASLGEQLVGLCRSVGLPSSELLTGADLSAEGLRHSNARLCLIYTRAAQAIAAALSVGSDPEEALQLWSREARYCMGLYRANRRRSMVFDVGSFMRYGVVGLARVGLNAVQEEDLKLTAVPSDPLLEVIAEDFLRNNSEAVHLSEALEASSQVLANSEAALPRDRAAAALDRYNAQAGRLDLLQEALAEAQKSDELLAEQNRHILAEMARLEKQVGLMQAERERLYGEASLVAEAEQKLREDLESRDRDLSGKEAHVRQLEAEINRIMSSRSIRLTAPLRRLGGFLRR